MAIRDPLLPWPTKPCFSPLAGIPDRPPEVHIVVRATRAQALPLSDMVDVPGQRKAALAMEVACPYARGGGGA